MFNMELQVLARKASLFMVCHMKLLLVTIAQRTPEIDTGVVDSCEAIVKRAVKERMVHCSPR